jgi:hypothetical protein
MLPSAKLDASASIINGWAGLTCANIGAKVNASFRARKASSASDVQVNEQFL